jgi:hypothetical protein
MATISLQSILDLLKQLLSDAYKNRNDAQKWEVLVEEPGKPKREAAVVNVSLEPLAFEFQIKDGDTTTKLKAYPSPTSIKKLKVEVNGILDTDAVIVYRPVPSIANPGRFHLDFKRVTLGDEDVRFNLAYPKG